MSLGRRKLDFESTYAKFLTGVQHLFAPQPQQKPATASENGTTTENDENTGAALGHPTLSGVEMYHLVYQMCIARPRPMHEDLFLKLAGFLHAHTAAVTSRIAHSPTPLETYAREWVLYTSGAQGLNVVCECLNKAMTAPLRGAPVAAATPAALGGLADRRPLVRDSTYRRQSVQSLAYVQWRDVVVRPLVANLVARVKEVVRADREGVDGPDMACRDFGLSLVTLQAQISHATMTMYVAEYESAYIVELCAYYGAESERYLRELSMSDFLKMAEQRLDQERLRSARYLHPASLDKIAFECHVQYLTNHKDAIRNAFRVMLDNNQSSDLGLAYRLMQRIPNGVAELTGSYERYVTDEGLKLLMPDPKTTVPSLATLHTTLVTQTSDLFSGDPKFTAAMDRAYRSVNNSTTPPSNLPRGLAQVADHVLRRVAKVSDADAEAALAGVLTLFVYVDDKDVFHRHYARLLARRLILRSGGNDELEYAALTRMKAVCGAEYTSKLSRMFSDVGVSAELGAGFRESSSGGADIVESSGGAQLDLAPLVLTAGSWPMSHVNTPALAGVPDAIAKSAERFTGYYTTKHSGRKLFWMWHLCRVDIRYVARDKKRYEINMALFQWAVLALFNEPVATSASKGESLTRAQITQAIGASESDTARTIDSLVEAGLLAMDSSSSATDPSVTLNPTFESKRAKIRLVLNLGAGGGGDADDAATRAAVEEDRKLYVQATMVRLLKAHRVIDHNQLVALVIEQSRARFKPSVALIKRCIEVLMDRGYMEREPGGVERYIYIA
ncbi:Cullin family-domain-containing protein [Blastocladiella britannica]|nr:Cullin family-domain-containing protein [Blastocladiella britannica]